MFTYDYVRANTDGHYDINNPARIDGSGNQIWLADEIIAALPSKPCRVICNGTLCSIEFETELTAGEKTTLDTVVANHKANT